MAAKASRLVFLIGGLAGCAAKQPAQSPAVAESVPAKQPGVRTLTCEDAGIAPQGCIGIDRVRRLPPLNGVMPDRAVDRPLDPEPHYRLATVLEEQGLLENALDEYHDALELSRGRHINALFSAARLSEQLGRRIDAVPLCQRFLARKASHDVPEQRAWCLELLGQAEDH